MTPNTPDLTSRRLAAEGLHCVRCVMALNTPDLRARRLAYEKYNVRYVVTPNTSDLASRRFAYKVSIDFLKFMEKPENIIISNKILIFQGFCRSLRFLEKP